MKQYISYSEMDLWFRDKCEYRRRYILGIDTPPEPKQILGKIIHATIENPQYRWLKELKELHYGKRRLLVIRKMINKLMIQRAPACEIGIRAETRDGIAMFSIFDGMDAKNGILYEYKTTDKQMAWNQTRVDRDEQLTFYAYVYHLLYHSYFREIRLIRANTKTGMTKVFRTARGPKDIEYIAEKVKRFVQEVKEVGLWEKRLSSRERLQLTQLRLPGINT